MELCSNGHEEVCYETRNCPCCELITEKNNEITELQSEISELNNAMEELTA